MRNVKYGILVLLLSSCAGTGVKKVVIDESHNRPSWVDDDRLSWEKDGRVWFKTKQTVRGDQRLNGCYVLASNDNRETMLRSMMDGLRGETNEAQDTINENGEIVLGKVRANEWSGRIYGFSDNEHYFQRIQIRDELTKTITERIDCYVLSSIGEGDYARTKSEVVNQMAAIDPRVKEAIVNKEANFFKPKNNEKPKEEPAIEGNVVSQDIQKQVGQGD